MLTSPYELQRLQRALIMKAKTVINNKQGVVEEDLFSSALVILSDVTQLVQQWGDSDLPTKEQRADIIRTRLDRLARYLKEAQHGGTKK